MTSSKNSYQWAFLHFYWHPVNILVIPTPDKDLLQQKKEYIWFTHYVKHIAGQGTEGRSSKESVGWLYVLQKGRLLLVSRSLQQIMIWRRSKESSPGAACWGGGRKQYVDVVAGARIRILGRWLPTVAPHAGDHPPPFLRSGDLLPPMPLPSAVVECYRHLVAPGRPLRPPGPRLDLRHLPCPWLVHPLS
jgi:hypothetical protein